MKLALNTEIDKEIFLELEKGIPITGRPFQQIGKKLGFNEKTVFNEIKNYYSKNLIRRFGGVFDIGLIGYKSCLCAVRIKIDNLQNISDYINKSPHITHCYLRDYPINLWFTFSTLAEEFQNKIYKLKLFFEPDPLLCLPAVKRFKTSVIFDLGLKKYMDFSVSNLSKNRVSKKFISKEKQLAQKLWDFPVAAKPYEIISKELELPLNYVYKTLNKWEEEKILKRIAIIPYHYNLGYKANLMCAWQVPSNKVNEIGKLVSENSNVTHCYERETHHDFKNNFYAMIHGSTLDEASAVFENISSNFNIRNGIKLLSTKEIKKTSLKLFQ